MKPRKRKGNWKVKWSETYTPHKYTTGEDSENIQTYHKSQDYNEEKTAREKVRTLRHNIEYRKAGNRAYGNAVVEGSIEMWYAPVGDWEEVDLG